MPTGRAATCADTVRPRSLASVMAASSDRHPSGLVGTWLSEIDRGRPDASAMPSTLATSSRGSVKSDTTWSTPLPTAPSPSAMPASSLAAAVKVGVQSPRLVRWLRVRDVVKPMAPASIASPARRAISAISSSVAGSRAAPRSPMT